MHVRAKAAAREPEPDVDQAQACAHQHPLLWIREQKRALRVVGRRTDECVGVGVATDDAMEHDEVVRLEIGRDEVADAPFHAILEAALRDQLAAASS